MIETIEDYCQSESINAILICGDIAFSGKQAEYEEKAKVTMAYILFKMKYYHLHEEYLASLKKQ